MIGRKKSAANKMLTHCDQSFALFFQLYLKPKQLNLTLRSIKLKLQLKKDNSNKYKEVYQITKHQHVDMLNNKSDYVL